MSDLVRDLLRAINMFTEDEDGLHICGHAHELVYHMIAKTHLAASNLQAINDDFWGLATIIDRLSWTRDRAASDPSLAVRWSYYLAADIEYFHVQLRSLLDYVTPLVAPLLARPGQAPDSSFRKLLKWCDDNPTRCNQELRSLLLQQRDWFAMVRAVRDALVHNRGRTIVFGRASDTGQGILFQAYNQRLDLLINEPSVLVNANVANFERYASLVIARLMCFMDDFGKLAADALPAATTGLGTRNYSFGYVPLRKWMRDHLLDMFHWRNFAWVLSDVMGGPTSRCSGP